MKTYTAPDMEIVKFAAEDVITTSLNVENSGSGKEYNWGDLFG